ncbi:MAG: DUF4190 domain-containing protein [Luteolibacter sp.]
MTSESQAPSAPHFRHPLTHHKSVIAPLARMWTALKNRIGSPVMNDDAPAEESEKLSQLGLARTSLVFGILSILLAFVFVFGLIAIFTGTRARRRLLKLPDTGKGATTAFCGMMLGGLSLVIGMMEVFAFPTANPRNGRLITARATSIAIESAVNNIYSEYGKIPDARDRVTTYSTEGVKFLTILLGIEDKASKQENFRGIKFLSVREGKNRKGGLILDATGRFPIGMFDPYGNPYTVILDTDYDEQLHFDIAGKPFHLKGRRVAVFSPGRDGKLGTSDDVKTWE